MDIHILCHGLGNQLSQYAFTLARRSLNQRAHAYYAFKEHNGYELDRLFGLKEGLPWYLRFVPLVCRLGTSRRFYSERTANFILSLFRIKVVVEPNNYRFDPELTKPWFGLRILYGGWHDWRYFQAAEPFVREAFRFPELGPVNQKILDDIDNSHSVSIHVRRGDYLKVQNRALFGDIATAGYYRNAIKTVGEHAARAGKTPKFFIFSDDIAWCQENLGLPDAYFVNANRGSDSWKDMALMARCKVNIIANSTFSWWAAWLNGHPDKLVLCPTKFSNPDIARQTIYPATWLHIES
ncbi:alpha-1,2-fucosyltransferase [Pandoraea fibrosis]|uniref:Alpha-1,2-fucosyltransferase n=2 Tax=Pandoraea fibrosis TaxID=1891094 RepID=A0ABX6HYD3_9BURK|nr:alpha-1,2-fucosyltransferase [Pandoraea fibrosis]QHF15983.1 alpha-1,2-fucosyltransferase [Pandoraea fibrosis]